MGVTYLTFFTFCNFLTVFLSDFGNGQSSSPYYLQELSFSPGIT